MSYKVHKVRKVLKLFLTLGTFCFINVQLCSAQNHIIDSLKTVLKTEQDDTNKVMTLNKLSEKLWRIGKYDSSMGWSSMSQILAEKLNYKKGLAAALRNIGLIYRYRSNYSKALEYYLSSLAISKQIGDKEGIAHIYGNIGNIYYNQGNYPKALEYDYNGLTIAEEIGDKRGIGADLVNIGLIYVEQGNYSQAIEYELKALPIKKEIGDKNGTAVDLGNIGLAYFGQGNYSNALEYDLKALAIDEELGDKNGMAGNLGNIGSIYANLKNDSKALEYDFKALAIEKELGDKSGITINMGNIGSIYTRQKKYGEARTYIVSSLKLAKEIGEKEYMKGNYSALAILDSATGDYKTAVEDFKNYIIYRDSLINEVNTKKTVQTEMNFQFEQTQAAQKAEQDKKDAVTAADKRKQNIVIASISLGLSLVVLFAIILLKRFRVTQQQKRIIEEQKIIVDEKNKDITDSIHYASRIQRALLTTDSYLGKRLKEYFILFKPRDIVSGDFYWANEVETNKGKRLIVCAGDCTGHGVPGAFMSLLNISMLNETTIEKKILSPAAILDDIREHIIKALNPEGKDEGSKDGMDCALCSFDLTSLTLEFACANNPLWIVRNNELIEFKPDKMPVGVQGEKHIPFTLQTTTLQKGDTLYLFTDGYADQFGGPKGKKFKYKQLQEKLIVISRQPLAEQKNILENTFEDWKGGLEQVDDVLIIGIRI